MKRHPSGELRERSCVLALVILVGALLVSVPAGCSAIRLWRRLPTPCLGRLEAGELQAAFDRVNRTMPAEAREGFALRRASATLTDAMTGAVAPEELLPAMSATVGGLSRPRVGRLQLAAARLWLLEQAGQPPERWWPALRVYLEGMRHADLEHCQAALTRHWAAAYQAAGVDPGTAYGLAEDLVGHPHGPFLEFFVPRLRRVIVEREQAGDAGAAAACRSALHGLLRQWVLEPGSAGLRLLAADLLADTLEADAAQNQELAQSLRGWRAAYRLAARARPIATLDPHRKPALAPAAHERLVARVALTTWLGSATLAAAIVALLFGWAWLNGPHPVMSRTRLVLYVIGSAAIVTAGGILWISLWPESTRHDLRSDFSSLRYWWRHPFGAAGLTLAVLLVSGLVRRRAPGGGPRYAARVGAAAAGTCLVLAALLWSSAWAGERARREYERALRAAHEDPVAAMLGSDAAGALSELRRWEP